MGMAAAVQFAIGLLNLRVYPRVRPVGPGLGTCRDDPVERRVPGNPEPVGTDRLGERSGYVKAVERQYCPHFGLHPENFGRVAAVGHRKYADRIGAQQHVGIEQVHRATINRCSLRVIGRVPVGVRVSLSCARRCATIWRTLGRPGDCGAKASTGARWLAICSAALA